MNKRILLAIIILGLATIGGFAVVIGDDDGEGEEEYEPIEAADSNPPVYERGAHRLIASNSVNQDETAENPDIYAVSAKNIGLRMASESEPLIRIDDTTFTMEQAEEYSMLTDGYREVLYTDTRLPNEDSWRPLADVMFEIEDIMFVGFDGHIDEPETTEEHGSVYVEIASEPGQLPLRNAEVLREENGDDPMGDLYIANPYEAEIYDGEMDYYEEINREAAEEAFLETGPRESIVPAAGYGDETARYEVHNETMGGEWHSPEVAIKDHYVGVARITEGAIYGDEWIVNPDGIEATTLHDYRVVEPYTESNQYTEDAPQCSYSCNCDEDGCSTCYATPERYEYYEFDQMGNEYMEILHNGNWYDEGNRANVFPIDDPESGTIMPYSSATAEFDHTYGVNYPSQCSQSDWERTETNRVTSVIGIEAEHPIYTAEADEVEITAYVADKTARQEVYFDIFGDQRPEENPIGTMRITGNGGEEMWEVHTPWIFFPQSLYDRVETRQEGWDHWNFTTVDPTDSPNNLHRDYMDGNDYKTSVDSTMVVGDRGIDEAQIFEGINVGEHVSDTQGDVILYRTYGGPILSTGSGERIEDIEGSAVDIFGNEIDVEVEYRDYESTNMYLEMRDGGNTLYGQLQDSDGNGVSGRTIDIHGGVVNQVTTNSNGEFEVGIDEEATTVRAEFDGDPLRDELDTHYERAVGSTFTGNLHVNIISTPLIYLNDFISNLQVVIHWILLGLFIVWWTKYREVK